MADDTKAKDLLRAREIPVREPLGQTIQERVGRRRSEAPGSQRRSRMFARLGLADPYDPDATERPIKLGSVGLKLTERRKPAPHARVKDNRPSKPATQAPAQARRPSPKPASPAPTQAPPAPTRPSGKGSTKKKTGVGEIPDNLPPAIRRRLEAQKAQQLVSEFKRPVAPRPPPAKPPPAEAAEPGRLPASLRPGGSSKKGRSPRVRMSRTARTGAPTVRELPPPEETVVEAQAPEPPPPERVERSPPPGANVGLDDLFGFANEGRMRLGRRTKKDPPPED